MNAYYIKKLIALGISTEDTPSIVGKTDFDLFNKATATLFYQNDQQIIKSQTEALLTEEHQISPQYIQRFITVKTPLLNQDKQAIGVIGSSHEISVVHINGQPIELNRRDVDCLAGIFKGMSAKMIAKHHDLSPRTVESYIENLKNKINCQNKHEIIQLILDNNLELILKHHK